MVYKVKNIMKEYFTNDGPRLSNKECPVVPSRDYWEVFESPERLQRKFSFQDRRSLVDFVSLVFSLEDTMGHHGKIDIDHKEVTISVYTKDINSITNIDREYVKHVDQIFRDVQDYKY
jgi:pterin-4a-carbinolamine dehydratase